MIVLPNSWETAKELGAQIELDILGDLHNEK